MHAIQLLNPSHFDLAATRVWTGCTKHQADCCHGVSGGESMTLHPENDATVGNHEPSRW